MATEAKESTIKRRQRRIRRSFSIEARTAPLEHVDELVLERFAKALSRERRLAGPASGGDLLTRVLSVRTSVDAVTPEEAIAVVLPRVRSALRRAGLGSPELTEASVQIDLPSDRFWSSRDDLVGTPEVAMRLGVSRERVRQLATARARFPASIASIRGTRVWRWGDIADWLAAGGRRRAGRPRSSHVLRARGRNRRDAA